MEGIELERKTGLDLDAGGHGVAGGEPGGEHADGRRADRGGGAGYFRRVPVLAQSGLGAIMSQQFGISGSIGQGN